MNVFTQIDLQQAAGMVRTRVVTPHILIIEIDGAEISLYSSGRMLVKRVRSEEEALIVAKHLLEKIGLELD